MSDSTMENVADSKTNLIEVHHVGVTAKIQSPLKNLIQMSSSSETDNAQYPKRERHTTKYDPFLDEANIESESTDRPELLYEMRTTCGRTDRNRKKLTPTKIEFQLYNKSKRRFRRDRYPARKRKSKRKFFDFNIKNTTKDDEPGLYQRLRQTLDDMCNSRLKKPAPKIFPDIPEPAFNKKSEQPKDTYIGIYPFDHGCAEYLRTTDSHPPLVSVALAERATYFATRFWAEFFGSLHIAVTFVVTFLLQSYRFILYSLVNTLLVGFLRMTSDYTIKPLLTVVFNGFLQPPLIFCYNVLSSIRDVLEPISDALNNFAKPIATIARGMRLVHVSYNYKKQAKEV